MRKRLNKPRRLSRTNLSEVPAQSGIYVIRNRKGDVQYVGKAGPGRLRERLFEHFNQNDIPGAELFQFRKTTSDEEAEKLEARYRERLRPKYGE